MAHSFSYPHSFLSPMDALYRPVRRRRFGDDEYGNGYVSIHSMRYVYFLISLDSLHISWHLPSWYPIGCVLAGNYLFPSCTSHADTRASVLASGQQHGLSPFSSGPSHCTIVYSVVREVSIHLSCILIFRSFPIL